MDCGCSRRVSVGGSRRWRTLGGRSLGWLGAALELSRRRIDTHTEGKRVEPPPLWFAALFQPRVTPRRRVATHEENGDNICEGGIAWVSAARGMRRGDLQGLDACAGMGRHRRGALGPEVHHGRAALGWEIGELGCAVATLGWIAAARARCRRSHSRVG